MAIVAIADLLRVDRKNGRVNCPRSSFYEYASHLGLRRPGFDNVFCNSEVRAALRLIPP